jgi:hypothetical protein
MSTTADWTPDSIAHALPTPDMRMEFLRQLNLTPIGELEALAQRWVGVIEDLTAAVDRGRELHAYQRQQGGELPTQYTDVTALITESRAA